MSDTEYSEPEDEISLVSDKAEVEINEEALSSEPLSGIKRWIDSISDNQDSAGSRWFFKEIDASKIYSQMEARG